MDEFYTYEKAKNKLNEWEAEDKAHGEYTPNFYEICEEASNIILCAEGTELQAMLTACEQVGFSPDAVTHLYNDGSITTGAGRSGRNIVWLLRGKYECAVYVDTGEILTAEQIKEELLS